MILAYLEQKIWIALETITTTAFLSGCRFLSQPNIFNILRDLLPLWSKYDNTKLSLKCQSLFLIPILGFGLHKRNIPSSCIAWEGLTHVYTWCPCWATCRKKPECYFWYFNTYMNWLESQSHHNSICNHVKHRQTCVKLTSYLKGSNQCTAKHVPPINTVKSCYVLQQTSGLSSKIPAKSSPPWKISDSDLQNDMFVSWLFAGLQYEQVDNSCLFLWLLFWREALQFSHPVLSWRPQPASPFGKTTPHIHCTTAGKAFAKVPRSLWSCKPSLSSENYNHKLESASTWQLMFFIWQMKLELLHLGCMQE